MGVRARLDAAVDAGDARACPCRRGCAAPSASTSRASCVGSATTPASSRAPSAPPTTTASACSRSRCAPSATASSCAASRATAACSSRTSRSTRSSRSPTVRCTTSPTRWASRSRDELAQAMARTPARARHAVGRRRRAVLLARPRRAASRSPSRPSPPSSRCGRACPTGRVPTGSLALLTDTDAFWPDHPVPSVPIDAPQFRPVRYWKGPTWVNTNWMLVEALRANDRADLAEELRTRTLAMVERAGQLGVLLAARRQRARRARLLLDRCAHARPRPRRLRRANSPPRVRPGGSSRHVQVRRPVGSRRRRQHSSSRQLSDARCMSKARQCVAGDRTPDGEVRRRSDSSPSACTRVPVLGTRFEPASPAPHETSLFSRRSSRTRPCADQGAGQRRSAP